jgi:hypothetical protein
VNLIVNGDFARFLSTTDGAATSVWGVSGFYTATRTGQGLSDPTHTSESAYAAKMASRPGWGAAAYWPIFDPASVSTYWVGMPVTVSFKFRSATPGVGHLSATESAGNAIGGGLGDAVDGAGIDAGNGWKQYAFTFVLSSNYIANGVGLQLSFNGSSAYYVADVHAVVGVSAPRSYYRQTRDRHARIEILPNGRLSFAASTPPSSGGDPVFGSDWRPGDVVWNTAPKASGPPAWICTAGGSPGMWKAMANLAP